MRFKFITALYACFCLLLSCSQDEISQIGVLEVPETMTFDNDITVGCEVLDRDYADYHSYKEYLSALGIRKIRLQAGWAKTEKTKGVYDFAWLDEIIDDAVARGLEPWLQTSYGNPVYQGGGTPFLAGGWPESEEALNAWHRWVEAMALRYKGKVHEWEIWNEADLTKTFKKNPIPFVDFTLETARTIRRVDPEAKIATFAWAGWRPELFSTCMSYIKDKGALELMDWITYHYYTYRPEDMYAKVDRMQDSLSRYSSRIVLRQGETGAPSKGHLGGALDHYDWTETSQAKWDLRRMLSDKGKAIPTTVFSISDMNYGVRDNIVKKNVKGLLETDGQNKVIRPKEAFHAVRNLVSLWNVMGSPARCAATVGGEGDYSLYAFESSEGDRSYALWEDSSVPSNILAMWPVRLEIQDHAFHKPVCVDIRTGQVYSVRCTRGVNGGCILELPAYDSPVLVVEKHRLSYK